MASVRWWLRRRREAVVMAIAWRVPRPVAYWVFVRLASNTDGNPGERTCLDVLEQHRAWAP